MFKFHTRIVGLVAVLAAIGSASVAEAKSHRYSATLVSEPLSVGDGYPNTGGTAFVAGTVTSNRFGTGAVVDHLTITGRPWGGPVTTFEGTEVIVFDDGTQRNKFTGYDVPQDDGSHRIVVNGRYAGGTERYRGATGRYKFEGTIPSGSTVLTGRSTGRVRF